MQKISRSKLFYYCTIELAHRIVSTSEAVDGAWGTLAVFCGGWAMAGWDVSALCDIPRRPPSIKIKSSSLRALEFGGERESSSQLPDRR